MDRRTDNSTVANTAYMTLHNKLWCRPVKVLGTYDELFFDNARKYERQTTFPGALGKKTDTQE